MQTFNIRFVLFQSDLKSEKSKTRVTDNRREILERPFMNIGILAWKIPWKILDIKIAFPKERQRASILLQSKVREHFYQDLKTKISV